MPNVAYAERRSPVPALLGCWLHHAIWGSAKTGRTTYDVERTETNGYFGENKVRASAEEEKRTRRTRERWRKLRKRKPIRRACQRNESGIRTTDNSDTTGRPGESVGSFCTLPSGVGLRWLLAFRDAPCTLENQIRWIPLGGLGPRNRQFRHRPAELIKASRECEYDDGCLWRLRRHFRQRSVRRPDMRQEKAKLIEPRK